MTTISIIGTGNMAAAIGTRAAEHGYSVEILGRDASKAEDLAGRIGRGATTARYGSTPAGDIVIVAVLYADSVDVVSRFGSALAGKTLIDISNPFNDDASGVTTTIGHSVAEQIAAVAPEGAHVVKAFNTLFAGVIATDGPVDVFYAGDDAEAKSQVHEFVEALGMQSRDAGTLRLAHALEWAGILLVGLAGNGAGFGASLKVEVR